jgi:uncharacterized protein YcfL
MKRYILGVAIMFGMMGCASSNEIELEGKIVMKGAEPFSYLSIKDKKSSKSYKIQNKESFDLMHKQKQVIKVKAQIIKEAVGPGFPAEIKIVEVE